MQMQDENPKAQYLRVLSPRPPPCPEMIPGGLQFLQKRVMVRGEMRFASLCSDGTLQLEMQLQGLDLALCNRAVGLLDQRWCGIERECPKEQRIMPVRFRFVAARVDPGLTSPLRSILGDFVIDFRADPSRSNPCLLDEVRKTVLRG